MPCRRYSSSSMARCAAISRTNSSSARFRRKRLQNLAHVRLSCSISLDLAQELVHESGHLAPAIGLLLQRLLAGFGDGVVFRLTIVLGLIPTPFDPTFLLQPDQRGIQGALVKAQQIFRDLLQARGDSVGMLRPHRR